MSQQTPWRSAVGDIPIRLMIIRKTQEVFESVQLPCEQEVFEETLQELAPKLEAELYRTAASLEEYGDPNTVQQRLERLAPQQGHLRPLEGLWLQGFLTRSVTRTEPVFGGAHGGGASFPITVAQYTHSPTEQDDSEPGVASHGSEESPSLSGVTPCMQDGYTQSLLELQRYLDRYDALSNRTLIQNASSMPIALPQGRESHPSNNEARQQPQQQITDLKCYERLDDVHVLEGKQRKQFPA